jgi:flagellar assembly factor FliW
MSVETLENPQATAVPVIDFVAPMAGFPAELRFVLVRVDESGLLYAMTSVDSPGLRFLVVPPGPFFPEYAAEIDDETLKTLAVADPERLLILLVVNTGDSAAGATVNLMAPIVLDQQSRRAVQLVLTGTDQSVRAPLMPARPEQAEQSDGSEQPEQPEGPVSTP